MPNRCCVPGCRSNYDSLVKTEGVVSVFKIPSDETLRRQWIRAIPRADWTPGVSAVVCLKHFKECDVITTIKAPSDGGLVVVNKQKLRPELVKGAIPCVFPNLPSYLTKVSEPARPSLSERSERIAARHEQEVEKFLSSNKIVDLYDFITQVEQHKNFSAKWLCSVKDKPRLVVDSVRANFRLWSDRQEPTCGESQQTELLLDMHTLHDLIVKFMPHVKNKKYALHIKCIDGNQPEYIFTSKSKTRRAGECYDKPCSECGSGIEGRLYKCVSCQDYWMCQECEALGLHANHVVVRISAPVKTKKAKELLQRCCDAMKKEGIEDLTKVKNKGTGKASRDTKHKDDDDSEDADDSGEIATYSDGTADIDVQEDGKNKKKGVKRKSTTVNARKLKKATTESEKISSNEENELNPTVEVKVEFGSTRELYETFMEDDVKVPVEEMRTFDPDPLGVAVVKQEIDIELDPQFEEGYGESAAASGPAPPADASLPPAPSASGSEPPAVGPAEGMDGGLDGAPPRSKAKAADSENFQTFTHVKKV